MSLEGHSPKPRRESAPPAPQTEEQARIVLENLIQMGNARELYRKNHPEIVNKSGEEVEPDGNEVMLEYITSGAAEDFRRIVGSMDEEGLRAALRKVRKQEGETAH